MSAQLGNIWDQFNRDLYRYILSQVKDEDSSKDILQDSFIKIQQNLPGLKDEKSLKFWVYRIVKNTMMDHFRQKKFVHSTEEMEFKQDDEESDERTRKLAECIMPFINRLPEIYKEALILTEIQNYSQTRLAEHLGISYSGAKSRVQRAKLKLRELFEQCCQITSDQYGNILDYTPRKTCCRK